MTEHADNPAIATVAFVTLGCPKNEVDTDLMRAAVEAAGYYTCEGGSEQAEGADAVVVNTCSFIQEATEASIETIFDVLEAKPPLLIVAGCIVSRYADDLASEIPEVTAFIKVGDSEALTKALIDNLPARSKLPLQRLNQQARSFEYLRIADGCDRKCTFCTIPSIRGAYTSREAEDILKQARQLLKAGTKELIVIAQDIGRYGTDLNTDTNLIKLLKELAVLPELKRLRLMYLQPEGLTDELIETMAQYPTIMPYLEIPLQHISPRILIAMGRHPRDVENFEQQLAKARKLMPSLSVRTTLIAGFPSETQGELDQLCDFIERTNLDYVGVFPYSPEEGTKAAELPQQIDKETRLQRAQTLRDLADSIGWQRAAQRIGQKAEVLIEGYDSDENSLIARTSFQAPDIDGIVRVTASKELRAEDFFSAHKPNTYAEVEFTDAILYDMDAVIISPDKQEPLK